MRQNTEQQTKHASVFCPTLGIEERAFDRSGFSAKGTFISESTVPNIAKSGGRMRRGRGRRNYPEYTGKAEISMVHFLAAGEICKSIF